MLPADLSGIRAWHAQARRENSLLSAMVVLCRARLEGTFNPVEVNRAFVELRRELDRKEDRECQESFTSNAPPAAGSNG